MYGLAVDPEVDKLFIAITYEKRIAVTSLDGSGALIVVSTPSKVYSLAAERKKR